MRRRNPLPNSISAEERLTYSMEEAAGLLTIGVSKVKALIDQGDLEVLHIGSRVVVLRSSLVALTERNRKQK